ncbi:bifunctional diaminohydroxyphosphoribosylaminopyrimidine deaminase/5-amino-6-(5-phosphoribosylamino)uracil reductase RibD [Salinispira pacifica]|uniref:Riboflavin biosynthesis protein RibD n=1 Tax=Salinispira pacifica TaxID=1307761 RepID=V5WEE7_9SPIO|nr:bifunctional diaminohydroxyphosphoribosylaminopyrimidine deaminase/5-amino-6-(5-phosphoribosylamino)uracil reductase RibD [Salinispira pacifica]AHC13939.1 Diaminohydroxyphosphoribosylaminopyrimidine deaminase/ 5-amino-6-(5-phosphoribosylamino)uracil reductase [Salinispira pacifica]
MRDETWMSKAIELAERGGRNVSPNPRVGAVIVENGTVIGEGYHARYGGPHAERAAIDDARKRTGRHTFPQATMYCTLEPCCHSGRGKHQPPCTGAILEAEIARVVIGHRDPNPKVNGRGVSVLESAGCRVDQNVMKPRAAALNPGFIRRMKTGRPHVTVKIAQSLDGRIAAASGDSKWITGSQARAEVHRMRADHDAILVGSGTVLQDNPRLTVRHSSGPDPLRIVLDGRLRTPADYRVAGAGTVFFCGIHADPSRIREMEAAGAQVRIHSVHDRYPLEEVLDELGSMGINSLLVEGGSGIFTDFLRYGLYQRLEVFTAPVILGSGVNALNDLGQATMADARHFVHASWQDAGDGNIRLTAYPEEEACLPD